MNWMFSCKEVTVLVSAAQDRKLSRMERFKIRLHLLFCTGCMNFNRQMATLSKAAHRLAGHTKSGADAPVLSSEARQRIKAQLHECEQHDEDPKS